MFKKAIKGIVFMGLNNKKCKKPAYWCPIHEVYLSKEDAEKRCLRKMSYDMMEYRVCNRLEKIERK